MDLEIQAKPGSGLAVVSLSASETTLKGPFEPGYGLDFVPMMPFSEPQFRGTVLEIRWEIGIET